MMAVVSIVGGDSGSDDRSSVLQMKMEQGGEWESMLQV